MSEQVAERIRRAIRERGPITFAEFMQHALYGPGGFYERPPVGRDGHFVTSPHVHPVFARLVGVGLERMWVTLERPVPFLLLEAGAGDGTMARELLEGFARGGIAVDYSAVEASSGARDALRHLPIRVHERVTDAVPVDGGVVLANELLDNLLVRRVRKVGDDIVELRVGIDGGRLVAVDTPCDEHLAAASPPLSPDEEGVVPVGAMSFIDDLAGALTRGYALLIDYGREQGPAGQIHGYRSHRVLEDVLDDPGSADITAGVDLGGVRERARARGFQAFEPVPQRSALMALGFEEWARRELEHQQGLLAAEKGLRAVRTWEGRSRASLLVDPAALGRLRWLVLATTGLPAPDWLEHALGHRTG